MKKEKAKKIAFLDRDGVINKSAPEHEYITKVEDFVFNPEIFDVLTALKKEGFEFIVVTNQRGVARGKLSVADLDKIHLYMKRELQKHNIEILDIFYCPHASDTCDCRKPKDGLFRQAETRYLIDKDRSIVIGDRASDIEAGKTFGLKTRILISTDNPAEALEQLPKRDKIKIAFVKYGGMSTGGTEKMLQIIAGNLDKSRYAVDFYYCDSTPFKGSGYIYPNTDPDRLAYAEAHGINLIKFKVGYVDDVHPYHMWRHTNFWEKFDETNYDIIQTGRSGHPEYPYTRIRRTPIAEIIALSAGTHNQYNIARSMHICQWSADTWIKSGGDKARVEIISLPIDVEDKDYGNFRAELGLTKHFIYGMHQRVSDDIFSGIPLAAYKSIETDTSAYILLGGSELYKKQATDLQIKNIHFLPATGNSDIIFKFLSTINVYAHGRKDGEVNSQAMAEAMYFGSPIVSHRSTVNNGHVECIGNGGRVLETVSDYAAELQKLQTAPTYYAEQSHHARVRFTENYELKKQIKRFEAIYESIMIDPYPYPIRRIIFSLYWTQNIRIIIKWIYRYIRYTFNI
jgi:D,D-heptose 1,7-bisphosphate phosphatase